MRIRLIALALFLLSFGSASGQDSRQAAGEKLIAASRWSEAGALFEELVRESPGDAAAWGALGLARLNLGRIDGAAEAYEKALALDPSSPRALVGAARVAVARGNKTAAIAAIERSRAAGINPLAFIRRTAGFDALVKDPEFGRFIETLRPCTAAPFRQFDFWLGEWEVFDPNGRKIGTNSITSTNDGCVLLESWTDMAGGTGSSFNFYENTTERWHQFWVNSSGNATPLSAAPDGTPMPMSGGLVDGKMVLQSPPATRPRNRWTWSKAEGGKVRQHAEQSDDEGVTWRTTFDGLYVKAK
jgi:hypothetical protein